MKTTRLGKDRCLACGREVDAATHMARQTPKPGDWTICLKCGHLMAFDDELHLRQLTAAETQEAAGNSEIALMQWAVAQGKH
jgi:hypothetical protein